MFSHPDTLLNLLAARQPSCFVLTDSQEVRGFYHLGSFCFHWRILFLRDVVFSIYLFEKNTVFMLCGSIDYSSPPASNRGTLTYCGCTTICLPNHLLIWRVSSLTPLQIKLYLQMYIFQIIFSVHVHTQCLSCNYSTFLRLPEHLWFKIFHRFVVILTNLQLASLTHKYFLWRFIYWAWCNGSIG